ncbi:MAG: autotransporter-associated beta strand repeat-containing protein [Rhodospirillales bacterium]|nr:autotransporter-associated beta strand repeat-containing protein [Acetobacter sp.]
MKTKFGIPTRLTVTGRVPCKCSIAAGVVGLALLGGLGGTIASGATRYWDVSAGAGNGVGGTGTWTSQSTAIFSTTATGDATLVDAAVIDNDIFQGTAGTITLGSSLAANSFTFNTTGYTINNTAARALAGPITLASSVNLNLTPAAGAILTLGSITGGTSGSSLTLASSTSASTDVVRVTLASGSTVAASAPISITTTGTGYSGFTVSSGSVAVNADITNNATATTFIGAASGATFNLGGALKGSATVQFSAGSSGGAGTVNLNGVSTNTGDTRFNGTTSGTVKLGVDNALSSSSAIVMGYSSGNGQKLDLNGHNQTIASLASNSGGTGSITSGASGTGTDTLTIKGSATTLFGLVISDGSTRKVALTLDTANTGTLQLSGSNTYTGGSIVNGGTLQMGNTNALSSSGALTVGGGKFDIFGYATAAGVVTLSSGSIVNSDASFQNVGLTGTSFSVSNGTASAILAGSGAALTKNGTGTVTLAAANTYTGTTSISGGTLILSSTGSINSSNSVLVTAGVLTLQNAFALSDAGTLSLTDGTTLNLSAGSGTTEVINGLLLNGTPVQPGTYSTSDLTAMDANITFTGNESLQVLSAVPEPTTALGGLLLVSVLGWNQRRRLDGIIRLLRPACAA